MFVERMFDFPVPGPTGKKSNTCSTRDEKRRVSRRARRARGLAGRSAGERARIFQAGGAGSGRAGSANFRAEIPARILGENFLEGGASGWLAARARIFYYL
jgi:hypothetical protein